VGTTAEVETAVTVRRINVQAIAAAAEAEAAIALGFTSAVSIAVSYAIEVETGNLILIQGATPDLRRTGVLLSNYITDTLLSDNGWRDARIDDDGKRGIDVTT
jgi:hypothetical protein